MDDRMPCCPQDVLAGSACPPPARSEEAEGRCDHARFEDVLLRTRRVLRNAIMDSAERASCGEVGSSGAETGEASAGRCARPLGMPLNT